MEDDAFAPAMEEPMMMEAPADAELMMEAVPDEPV